MSGFFDKLLRGDFMPHGHCFLWREDLLLMHVGGDIATVLAYFAIPLALVILVKRRDDLVFNWVFVMFALFIFCCGITHLLGAINIWNGYYHLEGISKVVTGIVSLITAVLAWQLLPRALALPSQQDLLGKNEELAAAEARLRSINSELEARIAERTEELHKLAQTDSLTGVANRRALSERLQEEADRARRYGNSLSVLMVDMDSFKALNDRYGHAAGDDVLVTVADYFKDICRTSDLVGRYGGEEFVLVLPNTDLQHAEQFATRLLQGVRDLDVQLQTEPQTALQTEPQTEKLLLTCSIGVAELQGDEAMDSLLGVADKAMYEAKASGRDRVCVAAR